MKILRTYLYPQFAYLHHAKLENEGIGSIIRDENIVSINPVYARAVGGIKLIVRNEDFENARKIIDANYYENLKNEFPENELENQRVCVRCGSTNIFQKSSWLIGLFWLLFMIPATKKKSEFICLDCSHEWK